MNLTERINEDLKQAMKNKDEVALRSLRAIKSALLLAKTDKGAGDEVDEQQGIQILQKLAKQRRESLEIYRQQNRADLATGEEQELAIIDRYLPQQMSEDEIRSIISRLISENNLSGAASVSKLMPLAIKELAGRADNKTVSAVARELLGQ
jgi:uncharacterized protein YqeY